MSPDEVRDRLWLAEALIQWHRWAEADLELQSALTLTDGVNATRYICLAESVRAELA